MYVERGCCKRESCFEAVGRTPDMTWYDSYCTTDNCNTYSPSTSGAVSWPAATWLGIWVAITIISI